MQSPNNSTAHEDQRIEPGACLFHHLFPNFYDLILNTFKKNVTAWTLSVLWPLNWSFQEGGYGSMLKSPVIISTHSPGQACASGPGPSAGSCHHVASWAASWISGLGTDMTAGSCHHVASCEASWISGLGTDMAAGPCHHVASWAASWISGLGTDMAAGSSHHVASWASGPDPSADPGHPVASWTSGLGTGMAADSGHSAASWACRTEGRSGPAPLPSFMESWF